MKKITLLILAVFFAAMGFAQTTVTIGTGTGSSSYSSGAIFGGYYGDERHAVLYTASELEMSDVVSAEISKIAFKLGSVTEPDTRRDIKIYIKEVSELTLATSMFSSGWNALVATAALIYDRQGTGIYLTEDDWNEFVFPLPFQYNGGNLLILTDTKSNDEDGGSDTDVYYHTAAGKHWQARTDYGPLSNTHAGTVDGNRADIKVTFDNIVMVACPAPVALTANNITVSGAEISWSEHGTANSWVFEYKKANDTDWLPTATTNNPHTLSGLDANTVYNARVKSVCGLDVESNYSSVFTFRTECGAITIGDGQWLENFNSYAQSALPNCWKRTVPYDAYGNLYPTVIVESGSTSLLFSGSETQMISTPEFVEEMNTLEIEFDLQRENTSLSGTFEVGVLSDPNDASTFVLIQDVTNLITVADGVYDRYTVSLASAPAGYHYVAFRQVPVSYYHYRLDNIDLHRMPDCPKPTISSVLVTSNSATVEFTENGSATEWQYVISTSSATDPNTSDIFEISSNILEIEDLTPNTLYYFWVRSICGFDEYSLWVARTFRTACGAATVGDGRWLEDFNSYTSGSFPACWTRTVSYATYPVITTSNGISLWFNGNETEMAATPEFAEEVNTFEIEFDLRRERAASSGIFEVGVLSDPNDTSTFVSIQNITDLITVADGVYQRFRVNLSSAPSGYHYIAFRQTEGIYYSYWLDNIDVHKMPDCPTPTITNIASTHNSATVNFTENGSATDWQYVVSTSSTADPDMLDVFDIYSNIFEIENLTPNTQYYFWVRSVCGFDEYSFWTMARSFITECAVFEVTATNPFFEDFENGMPCWSTINASGNGHDWVIRASGSNPELPMYFAYSGNYFAASPSWDGWWTGYHADNYLITPKLVLPEGNIALEYWVGQTKNLNDNEHYSVLVSTTGTDTADFTVIFEETLTNLNWENRIISLNDYAGQNIYVAFRHFDSYNIEMLKIDDVEVYVVPDCPRPTIIDVSDITAGSVTVTLQENGSAMEWQYLISTTSTMPDESNAVNVNTDTFTISDLEANTQYYLWVRSVCGFGEQSNWRTGRVKTARCDDPCIYKIIGYDSYGDGWNGSGKIVVKANGEVIKEFYSTGYTSQTTFPVCPNINLTFEWADGTYLEECAFEIYDNNEELIFGKNYGEVGTGGWSPNLIWNTPFATTSCPAISGCPKPLIANIAPETDGATVTITERGDAENWQYVYSTGSTANPDNLTVVDVNTETFEIEGLAPNTPYYIWVRSVCDEGEYSDWQSGNFRTSCVEISVFPYEEHFNTGATLDCWRLYKANSNSNLPVVGNGYPEGTTASGRNYLYFSSSDDITAVLPIFDVDVNRLQIEFVVQQEGSYSGDFHLGYLTDINDPSTFVMISDVPVVEEIWVEHSEILSSVPAGIKNIAFKTPNGTYNWYYWVDDIIVTALIPDVPPAVTTLTATNITHNSATLNKSIEAGTKPVLTWGYEYRVSTATVWETIYETDSLDGLTEGTRYQFRAFATTEDGKYDGEILDFTTGTVGIVDVLAGKIILYPNPATNEFKVESGELKIKSVEITDLTGKIIVNCKLSISNSIDVSTFADGTYLVRIITEQGNYIQKLVVKK